MKIFFVDVDVIVIFVGVLEIHRQYRYYMLHGSHMPMHRMVCNRMVSNWTNGWK